MNKQKPKFETMPEHYLLCFSNSCSLADNCLHRLAASSGQIKDEIVQAVNSQQCNGESCRHYKENKVTRIAYGMLHSFHDVKADDIASLRKMLINHFGRGSYYLRRNGIRPITPEDQQFINDAFSHFGYEATYDRVVEETQWL